MKIKKPINETQPKRNILGSSITDMLDFGRPTFSSTVKRFGKIGLFSIISAAAAITAHAQSYTWDGGGLTQNWSDNNNWSGNIAPSSGAAIHFGGSVDLTPNNNLNLLANSIAFDSNASAFTLSGNSITLTNGITNNSSATQTINMPVQLSGAQSFSAASGPLTFGSSSTVDLYGSALTVSGSNIVTFNGVISDSASSSPGSLTVSNTADVFLNAANTYTGSTTVNGTLILNGSVASSQTTIGSSGILVGNGTVGGNLTNNGFLIPLGGLTSSFSNFIGASVSSTGSITLPLTANNVLTVKGNFTQGSSGILGIIYGGAAPSQHTALNVLGQANLGGALVVVPVNGAQLVSGQSVPIVTAGGGVNGTFSLVETPALLNASVGYQPNAVVLQFSQNSIVNTLGGIRGLSTNLLAVGKGLDTAAGDPRAAKIFGVLNSDSLGKLVGDIGHIDPDKLTSMSGVGSATSGVHLQNLQLRMQALQSGVSGFSAMGFHVTDNTSNSTATDTTATGYAGPSGPEGKGGKEVAPPPADNRWGTFITGSGEFTSIGDTQTARGFNLDSGGITLGVDYRFTDHFVAGIFAGYTYTGIDISDGRIAVDTGKFGIYGTYFDGGFYVNSAVQGGYDTYDTNRTNLGGNAHSSPVGGDFNLLFAPGYNWTMGGLTFGPTSRFQYSYESTNGFTESGSLAPLKVDSQHSESIVSAFGVKASYDWKVGSAIIRPELRLEWEHEYGDVATDVTSQLASGAGIPFTVTGPQIGRDDLHLGAGVAVVFSDSLTAYVYYDGQYFRTNYDSSTVTGGFRFQF